MSDTPESLLYASTHEWARIEGDRATVGITDYAQEQLGDIVYVELPDEEIEAEMEEEVAVIESVKAASDIYAPLSGVVVAVNDLLDNAPETINQDPYGEGWIFVLQLADATDTEHLLSADEYRQRCEEEEGEE